MSLLSLTTIPTDFGSGGSGLTPNGSTLTPSLRTLLQEHKTALESIDAAVGFANPEEVSSNGALSVTIKTTRLTVSGTRAYTLADSAVSGFRKRLYCVSAGSSPHGVVTPAHASGFTTIDFTTAAGWVDLEFDSSLGTPAWKVVGVAGTVTIS